MRQNDPLRKSDYSRADKCKELINLVGVVRRWCYAIHWDRDPLKRPFAGELYRTAKQVLQDDCEEVVRLQRRIDLLRELLPHAEKEREAERSDEGDLL